MGDGMTHTLSVTGPAGTVPVLSGQFAAGVPSFSLPPGMIPTAGTVATIGDCAVVWSEFESGEASCMENGVPPQEVCWSVTLQ